MQQNEQKGKYVKLLVKFWFDIPSLKTKGALRQVASELKLNSQENIDAYL